MNAKGQDKVRAAVPKTIPEKVDPLVKNLYVEMRKQQATYQAVADRSGVSASMIVKWRSGHTPNLASIRAAYNALGMDLTWRSL